jgi:hypothetical protein
MQGIMGTKDKNEESARDRSDCPADRVKGVVRGDITAVDKLDISPSKPYGSKASGKPTITR